MDPKDAQLVNKHTNATARGTDGITPLEPNAGQLAGVGRRVVLDSVALEELVRQIRASRAAQLERVQAIADGAVLAAEQVQDNRIELLETGPEVAISDVIFDMLLGLSLRGVGVALVPVGKSIAKELAQSLTWYARNGNNPRFAKVLGMALRRIDSSLADTRLDAKGIQQRHKQVRDLLNEKIGSGLRSLGNRGSEFAKDGLPIKVKNVELEGTDSPGVAMLGAAQSYTSGQRFAIELFHDGFEAIVRSGQATASDLAGITDSVSVSKLGLQIIEVRDRYKLLFEAAVWVRLYNFDGVIKARGMFKGLTFAGLPLPLKRYLRRRFARTIELWMTGLARDAYNESSVRRGSGIDLREYGAVTGEGRGVDKFTPAPLEELHANLQDSAVHRFFLQITEDNESVRREQGTSDSPDADGLKLREPLRFKTK